ncbi:MAG: lysine--tRNA ligase, partial [Nanoarchaeota archaeon]|nr:lysine--tRNA ligase [Nanoarchaeota archaeon]
YPPPYPSTRTEIGKGYEFFTVGGKKMSTSKGTGVGFADISKTLSPKMIRYLLIKSRPHTVLDFDPEGRNDLILLYDRYDYTERVYFKKEQVEDKEYNQQKRIYELSHVGDIPKNMPIQIPLAFAATTLQISLGDEQAAIDILRKMEHLPEEMSGIDEHYVLERLRDAKNWLDKYAPEEVKFAIQDKVDPDLVLDEKQKNALHAVAERIRKKKYKEQELHNEFYEICKETDIEVKDFFKAAYMVLLKKERGPKLAGFVLTLGDRALKLFENV